MARASAALLLAATPVAGWSAATERDYYRADWIALGSREPARTGTLVEKKEVPFGELAPRAAFHLADAATGADGNIIVPAGTVFLAVRGRPIRCELARRPGQPRIFCLHDRDGDGRYDAWNTLAPYAANGGGEVFVGAQPWRPETKPLRTAVTLRPLAASETPRFTLNILFENRAEWVGHNVFMPCIVSRVQKGLFGSTPIRLCQRTIDLRDKDYPRTVALHGGQLTFLSRDENRVQLRIVPPPADVPF